MDSRVFVQGLPPNLTNEELGKHFAGRYQITDAQIIPKRGIGFVGFRNYTLAKNAIQYFDKSYLRMHKIHCSMAEPVQIESVAAEKNRSKTEKLTKEKSEHKHKAKDSVGGEVAQNENQKPTFQPYTPVTKAASNLKRKRDADGADEDSTALREYLDVMRPPTKSKTWANEESYHPEDTSRGPALGDDTVETKTEAEQSQGLDKKEKKHKMKSKSSKKTVDADEPAMPNLIAKSEKESDREKKKKKKPKDKSKIEPAQSGGKSLDADEDPPEELYADPYQLNVSKSNADWLRSRTSRLLGLVDEEDAVDVDTGDSKTRALNNGGSMDDSSEGSTPMNAISRRRAKVENNEIDASDESVDANVDSINASGRLFIRNLPYTATNADLEELFLRFGKLEEVHVATDTRSETSKGFAYVQFLESSDAVQAYKELDRKDFQGRLLHILPASAKVDKRLDEYEISKLPLKKQKQIRRKADAAASSFSWNSLYMNANAVMASVADRLGLPKSEVLDPTSSDAAVKQAHAETHVIQEAKSYFSSRGVNLDAFKSRQRGDKAILVKNFSYGVKDEDIRKLFGTYGEVNRFLMPPSGTIAIVEFANAGEANLAFKSLAYKKLGDSILFLEKAPKDLFSGTVSTINAPPTRKTTKPSTTDILEPDDENYQNETSTLFVRNLNFSTTTAQLSETFKPLDGFLSAKVKTKSDPKKPGELLSMGFGFIEFRTKAQAAAALEAMNGYSLEGHELLIKASHKGMDAGEEKRRADNLRKVAGRRTKIIIKNLPFEASKKDVRALFGSYGQLRSVRVPKKFDSSTRGFAFADFSTSREAENAMNALRNTHLLGRKLVLEFAAEDTIDPEEEIQKMQKKVGQQMDKVASQKLTGSGRKKFNVERSEDAE